MGPLDARNSQRSRGSSRERPIGAGITILAMDSQFEIYEQIRSLSARMVDAARAGDWEDLIRLEQSVARLKDSLMAEDAGTNLTPEDTLRKASIIQRILDDDAEVRRHTEPWMEKLRAYLTTGPKKRQVVRPTHS